MTTCWVSFVAADDSCQAGVFELEGDSTPERFFSLVRVLDRLPSNTVSLVIAEIERMPESYRKYSGKLYPGSALEDVFGPVAFMEF